MPQRSHFAGKAGLVDMARWTARDWFATSPLLARTSSGLRTFDGRIAQLVEQLTLNQRVPGSSPGAPTIEKFFRNNPAFRLAMFLGTGWEQVNRSGDGGVSGPE